MVAPQISDYLTYKRNLCPICFLPQADVEMDDKFTYFGECARCGEFGVTEQATDQLARDPFLRRKVQWITRRWMQGKAARRIWASTDFQREDPKVISLSRVDSYDVPLEFADWRADTLLALARIEEGYGSRTILRSHQPYYWYKQDADFNWMIKQLQSEGLFTLTEASADQESLGHLDLHVKFWMEVEQLQRTREQTNRRTVFVASWFDDEMDVAIESGVMEAVRSCGYEPVWLKHNDKVEKIDDEIIAAIRTARFVIVDVTGNRSAVYFEAGFAMGLARHTIWTCREDSVDTDLCFDTRQYSHIIWSDPSDLRAKLEARIRARNL